MAFYTKVADYFSSTDKLSNCSIFNITLDIVYSVIYRLCTIGWTNKGILIKKPRLTALADLTVLPLHLGVGGVAPRHGGGVRVTAVVVI